MSEWSKSLAILAVAALCAYLAGRFLSGTAAKASLGAAFGLVGAGGVTLTRNWPMRALLILIGVVLVIVSRSLGVEAGA